MFIPNDLPLAQTEKDFRTSVSIGIFGYCLSRAKDIESRPLALQQPKFQPGLTMTRNTDSTRKISRSLPTIVCFTLAATLIVMAYGGSSSKATDEALFRSSRTDYRPPAVSATTNPDDNPTPEPEVSPVPDPYPDITEGCDAIKYVGRNQGYASATQLSWVEARFPLARGEYASL